MKKSYETPSADIVYLKESEVTCSGKDPWEGEID